MKAADPATGVPGEQHPVLPHNRRHLVLLHPGPQAQLSLSDIVKAILSGRQPAELSAKRLSLCHTLPGAWPEQMSMLGIA